MTAGPLLCPKCAEPHALGEERCEVCGSALVYSGSLGVGDPVPERDEIAGKIDPRYVSGDLVRVVGAGDQAEAEFIQGLLLEEGIPSTLRRTRGFDVPDMLAAGPRDVMVPASGHAAAREVLLQSEIITGAPDPVTPAWRVLAGLLAACAVVALIAWLGTDVLA